MAGKTATISMLIGGDASGLRKATKNATRSLQKFSKSTANATKNKIIKKDVGLDPERKLLSKNQIIKWMRNYQMK